MPLPLALTDDQRDTLMRCASALQRADRDRFLQLSRVARLRQRMCSSHIRNSPKADDRPTTQCICGHVHCTANDFRATKTEACRPAPVLV